MGITSTTGISALLFGGMTLHSFLGIGLGEGSVEYLVKKIWNRSYLRKRWTAALLASKHPVLQGLRNLARTAFNVTSMFVNLAYLEHIALDFVKFPRQHTFSPPVAQVTANR